MGYYHRPVIGTGGEILRMGSRRTTQSLQMAYHCRSVIRTDGDNPFSPLVPITGQR